jgi:folate-binding protein YgfZ
MSPTSERSVWCEVPRDFVAARGPDAASFLQGQCSQDILALDAGASAWTFVLQPSGKVEVLARVHRVNDETFTLDVDGGFGDAMLARLRRFKIRVNVDLDPLGWPCLAVRNADLAVGPGALMSWWGCPGDVDLVGPEVVPPSGAAEIGADAYERLRVEAVWPAMGRELGPDTIPAESGVVPVAVSFSKGCYTGQELVARIDSRGGNVPRHLRRVRLGQAGAIAPGARITVGDKDVGAVTSVAGDLALGYVARAVVPPASVLVDGTPAEVEEVVLG